MNCSYCHSSPHLSGCPRAPDPPVMDYCLQCGEELRADLEYYTDKDGNKFCSEECAIKYNEIKSQYWEE